MRSILLAFTRNFHCLSRMDTELNQKVSVLIQRLKAAERRSKLLTVEIHNIRKEITTLTDTANSLLIKRGPLSSDDNSSESNTSETANTSKRKTDETDFEVLKRPRFDFRYQGDHVVAYTDGACENNGKANAKAGVGVWFGENHPLNISKPVVGKATNNTAEIQACTLALQCLKEQGISKAMIVTDSQFTINCMTQWIKKWKKNDWKLSSGGQVKNKDTLTVLDNMVSKFQDVKWEYVAGHKGIRGNEEADRLARQGAMLYRH